MLKSLLSLFPRLKTCRYFFLLIILFDGSSVYLRAELVLPSGDSQKYASFDQYQSVITQNLPEYYSLTKLEILSTEIISSGLFAKTQSEAIAYLTCEEDLYEKVESRDAQAVLSLNTRKGTIVPASVLLGTEFMPGSVMAKQLSGFEFSAFPLSNWKNRRYVIETIHTESQKVSETPSEPLQNEPSNSWGSLTQSGKDYVWIDKVLYDVELMEPVPGNWQQFTAAYIQGSDGIFVAIETDDFDDPAISRNGNLQSSDEIPGVFSPSRDFTVGVLKSEDNQTVLDTVGTPWTSLIESNVEGYWVSSRMQEVVYLSGGDIWKAEINWSNSDLKNHQQITHLGNIRDIQLLAWKDDRLYFSNQRKDALQAFEVNLKTGLGNDVNWGLPEKEGYLNPTRKLVVRIVPSDYAEFAYFTNIQLQVELDFYNTYNKESNNIPCEIDHSPSIKHALDYQLVEVENLETGTIIHFPLLWSNHRERNQGEPLWIDSSTFLLGRQIFDLSEKKYTDLSTAQKDFDLELWEGWKNARQSIPAYYPNFGFIEGNGAQFILKTGEARFAGNDHSIEGWINQDEYLYVNDSQSITKRGLWLGNIATGKHKLLTRAIPFHTYAEANFVEVQMRQRKALSSILITHRGKYLLFYANRGKKVYLHVLNTSDWSERIIETDKPSSDRYIRRFELTNFVPRSISFNRKDDSVWVGSGFSQNNAERFRMHTYLDSRLIHPINSNENQNQGSKNVPKELHIISPNFSSGSFAASSVARHKARVKLYLDSSKHINQKAVEKYGIIRAYSMLHVIRSFMWDEVAVKTYREEEARNLQTQFLENPKSYEVFLREASDTFLQSPEVEEILSKEFASQIAEIENFQKGWGGSEQDRKRSELYFALKERKKELINENIQRFSAMYQEYLEDRQRNYEDYIAMRQELYDLLDQFLLTVYPLEKQQDFIQYYQRRFIRFFEELSPISYSEAGYKGIITIDAEMEEIEVIRSWMAQNSENSAN